MAIVKKKNTSSFKSKPIIVVVCILILVLIPFFIGFLSHKSQTTTTPVSQSQNNFIPVQGQGYSVSYPQGWKESESGVPKGNGQVFYFQPANADPVVKPHVIVQVTDATQTNIERTNLAYTVLKYKKIDTTVDGIIAQKYVNVLPSVHGPFHSISYVFQDSGKLYLVELGYTQKDTDSQLENEFSQIVASFTFQ